MANSQLSQLAAIGRFNGTTVTQTTPSRGFGAIVRTAAIGAGSWDITVDRNVAGAISSGEAVVIATAEGVGPAFNLCQCSLVDEVTLRVQLANAAGAGALADGNFSVVVHRVN